MAKKKETNKKPIVETKQKIDNSIEIQVNKSPGRTLFGKIVAWLIIAGTLLVPLATLIYIMCI